MSADGVVAHLSHDLPARLSDLVCAGGASGVGRPAGRRARRQRAAGAAVCVHLSGIHVLGDWFKCNEARHVSVQFFRGAQNDVLQRLAFDASLSLLGSVALNFFHNELSCRIMSQLAFRLP